MIEIKNVSKTYNGNIKAIDNLNLKINDGEIVGFIGLNGAGKTTAIKMMTGILVPDTGTITINGYDIVKDSLKAKQIIGYIADNPDMFLKLTGIEFINFIANIYKVPVTLRKKRIKLFGERFGLSVMWTRRPSPFSRFVLYQIGAKVKRQIKNKRETDQELT